MSSDQVQKRIRSGGFAKGRQRMRRLIDSLSAGVPAALTELITLGRTLKWRADDVLAYFDRPSSNGPTEAINGRLELPYCGSAR